ncbi:MAG: type II and III secretion system protein [Planctomycetes bacterium]|nr:type II and III secretion system protein [Planctomycetota bacterium]
MRCNVLAVASWLVAPCSAWIWTGGAAAQDATPPQEVPVPSRADIANGPPQDEILYEKYRFEKDGFVTIYYRVGHDHGRLLKAILEGQSLQVTGQSTPAVSVTPEASRARVLTPEGWALETESLHLLIVSDKKENVPFIERALRVLDVPDPQVIIEARVVEMRWDRDLQFGIEGDLASSATTWINNSGSEAFLREVRARFNPTEIISGGPFQGSVFRFNRVSAHDGTIGGLVQMFVENGKAEILSNPRVIVESGDQAMMSAGEEVPYFESVLNPAGSTTTVRYRQTGVTLTVRPHIVGASNVQMDLAVEVTALLGFVTGPSVGGATAAAPSFTTRKVNTKVTVHDGDEVVMGGLTRKEKTRTRRGLPLLSDIPILGWLFGRYEEGEVTQEILFFIRPIIVQGARILPAPIIDPDRK